MLEAFIQALKYLLRGDTIILILLGNIIGLVFGALPGLGGVIALAIILPFTFGMDPMVAFFFLSAIMGSIAFGGSISAILLNTPGTAPNAATCLDGYPMACKGEARKALGISATASGLGAIFGIIVLALLIPIVRSIVMLFGPPEFFMLVLFGLITVAFAAKGNLLNGLFAGGVGILISLIGYSPVFGILRFEMGSEYLWDGIEMIPFMIGIFAISELINYSIKGGKIAQVPHIGKISGVMEGVLSVFRNFGLFLRCSIIGCIIGIIPGVGGAVSNFLAYGHAVQSAKDPEKFGTGDIRGVIAPEAANDSKDGGALVPTLIFGIPGSLEMAVFLGALIVLGFEPGPRMLMDNPESILVLIYTLVAGNILVSLIGIFCAGYLCRLTYFPNTLLAPVIFMLALMGSYLTHGMLHDVVLSLVFGVLSLAMKRFGFSRIAVVIALVLGTLAQKKFHQTLMLWGFKGFFNRPISLGLFIITVSMILLPYLKSYLKRRNASQM